MGHIFFTAGTLFSPDCAISTEFSDSDKLYFSDKLIAVCHPLCQTRPFKITGNQNCGSSKVSFFAKIAIVHRNFNFRPKMFCCKIFKAKNTYIFIVTFRPKIRAN